MAALCVQHILLKSVAQRCKYTISDRGANDCTRQVIPPPTTRCTTNLGSLYPKSSQSPHDILQRNHFVSRPVLSPLPSHFLASADRNTVKATKNPSLNRAMVSDKRSPRISARRLGQARPEVNRSVARPDDSRLRRRPHRQPDTYTTPPAQPPGRPAPPSPRAQLARGRPWPGPARRRPPPRVSRPPCPWPAPHGPVLIQRPSLQPAPPRPPSARPSRIASPHRCNDRCLAPAAARSARGCPVAAPCPSQRRRGAGPRSRAGGGSRVGPGRAGRAVLLERPEELPHVRK